MPPRSSQSILLKPEAQNILKILERLERNQDEKQKNKKITLEGKINRQEWKAERNHSNNCRPGKMESEKQKAKYVLYVDWFLNWGLRSLCEKKIPLDLKNNILRFWFNRIIHSVQKVI